MKIIVKKNLKTTVLILQNDTLQNITAELDNVQTGIGYATKGAFSFTPINNTARISGVDISVNYHLMLH